MMANTNFQLSPWPVRLQQSATFLFLVYLLFLLGRSGWDNAKSNQKMLITRQRVTELQHENQQLEYLILYERTPSFRELEARRKLNIKKPGELVLALPIEKIDSAKPQYDVRTDNQPVKATPEQVLEEWWKYFTS